MPLKIIYRFSANYQHIKSVLILRDYKRIITEKQGSSRYNVASLVLSHSVSLSHLIFYTHAVNSLSVFQVLHDDRDKSLVRTSVQPCDSPPGSRANIQVISVISRSKQGYRGVCIVEIPT